MGLKGTAGDTDRDMHFLSLTYITFEPFTKLRLIVEACRRPAAIYLVYLSISYPLGQTISDFLKRLKNRPRKISISSISECATSLSDIKFMALRREVLSRPFIIHIPCDVYGTLSV